MVVRWKTIREKKILLSFVFIGYLVINFSYVGNFLKNFLNMEKIYFYYMKDKIIVAIFLCIIMCVFYFLIKSLIT